MMTFHTLAFKHSLKPPAFPSHALHALHAPSAWAMPPRPPFPLLRRPLARFPPPWTCHACLQRTPASPPRRPPPAAAFHGTARLRSARAPSHYDTLQLGPTASAAEIKRQFYTLSKKHHPDRNQNDPDASTRFVAISEAYHVLSVPEKRAQYDATLAPASQDRAWGRRSAYPEGSHSSASFGARPASGLNKKRSTFRGPPPSFYKAGGYGEHGAKRAEYAYSDAHEGQAREQAGPESYGEHGGYGPGQQKHGNGVPHFDDKRHKETHDNVYKHIWGRRRRTQRSVRVEEDYERGSMLLNFLILSGVIGLIGMTAKVFGDHHEAQSTGKRQESL